jgi:NitT/TauT family transport system permease protein
VRPGGRREVATPARALDRTAPVPSDDDRMIMGVRDRLAPVLRGATGFVVLLLVWEALSRTGTVNPAFLPPASEVLLRLAELLVDPPFLGHVAATMQAWAIGLGVSVVVAVTLGVLLGSSKVAYAASRALIEFLRPIPSVALIPLAILLFGRGTEMKVSLIIYASIWPILFNTIYGMADVDPVAKDTARSFGFGRLKILAKVSLPSALPFIYTGIRVASAVALILAVSAELIGGGAQGLGVFIQIAQATGGRPDLVLAGTLVAGMLGWAINYASILVERRFLGWQPALRGRA